MKALIAGASVVRVGVFLSVVGALSALAGSTLGLIKARGVALPIYAEGESAAVAAVHVGHFYPEKRKLGYFRVKLCPRLIAADVEVNVRSPHSASNLLVLGSARLQELAGGAAVELRNLQVMFPGETAPRLTARRLWPTSSQRGFGMALQGVCLLTDKCQLGLPSATIPSEPAATAVVWHTDDAVIRYDFFTQQFQTNQLPTIGSSP
jgi:hypothetical protein